MYCFYPERLCTQKAFALLACILFCMNTTYSQGIYTGNHFGQGIVFNQLTDIYILPEGPKATECYVMDFNQDGISDLVFCTTVWSRYDSINHTTEVFSAQNTTQMIMFPPEPEWIYQLSSNYWVDEDDSWAYSGILQYQRTTPNGYAFGGIFDEGYIGFRIPIGNKYMYGWVKVIASTVGIVLQNYAYQTILTSAPEYQLDEEIKIFPNPAANTLNIQIPDEKEFSELQILDMQGRILQKISCKNEPGLMQIPITSLDEGMYYVKLMGHDIMIKRFIKHLQ